MAQILPKLFEISISASIIPKQMEGCTEFTNVTYNVTTTIFMKDNIIMGKRIISTNDKKMTESWRNAEDKHHREGDLPAVTNYKNGKITEQYWYKDGKYHREGDQPAIIYFRDGKIISRCWRKGGKYHREGDQPAVICYKNDKITAQYWYKDGKLHREGDRPAIIYYEDDKITEQRWYKNDVEQPAPKPKEPMTDILARIHKDLAELEARMAEIGK